MCRLHDNKGVYGILFAVKNKLFKNMLIVTAKTMFMSPKPCHSDFFNDCSWWLREITAKNTGKLRICYVA